MLDQRQMTSNQTTPPTTDVRRALSSDTVDVEIARGLYKLIQLVKNQFFTLANSHPPEGFTKLYLGLEYDIERFKEICAFPAIAQKVTTVFAGSVGAGKTTVLNKLLQGQVIISKTVGVDALPTYMMKGDEDATYALNIKRQQIDFSALEAQKTQDKVDDDDNSAVLQTTFIFRKSFPWNNLAIIDTTGYHRTEDLQSDTTALEVSRSQLNLAQTLIWVISAFDSDLSETDASMLGHVSAAVPKVIVITQACKVSPEALEKLKENISIKLKSRNIAIEDIIALPSAENSQFSLQPILNLLQKWNSMQPVQRFAYYFKLPFTKYMEHLESEMSKYELQINRYDRILSVNSDPMVAEDIQELRKISSTGEKHIKEKMQALEKLQTEFFALLKEIGDRMKVLFPDPSSVAQQDPTPENLRRMLRHLREAKKIQLKDHRESFRLLELNTSAIDVLMRRVQRVLTLPLLEQSPAEIVVQKLVRTFEQVLPVAVLDGNVSTLELVTRRDGIKFESSLKVLM